MDGIILLCPAAAGMLMLLVIFVEHMNALVDDAPVDLERRNGLAMVLAIIRVGEVPAQVRDHLLCDLGPAAIRRGGDPFLIMRWASSLASNNAPADAATTATTCRTGAAGGGGVGGGCRLVDRHSPAAAARDRRSRRDYATFRHRGERSTRTRYFNHHLVATHEPQHRGGSYCASAGGPVGCRFCAVMKRFSASVCAVTSSCPASPLKRTTANRAAGWMRSFILGPFGRGNVSRVEPCGVTNRTIHAPPAPGCTIGAVMAIFSLAAGDCATGAVMAILRLRVSQSKILLTNKRKPLLAAALRLPYTATSATTSAG